MRRRWLIALAAVAGTAVVVVLVSGGGRSPHPAATSATTAPTSAVVTPTSSTPTVTTPTPGAPARPAPMVEEFGLNVNRVFDPGVYSGQQIDALLHAARATGATVARTDTLWEVIEPQPPTHGVHHYNWAFDDMIAAHLAAGGLQWTPIVDYAPGWNATVQGPMHAPPSSVGNFAAFAAALAARYGPNGSFWATHPAPASLRVETYEIWNEPDSHLFWPPAANPAQYAQLYLSARNAIDSVDPSARVIVGGLTDATTFVPAMVAAEPGLRGHIDGVGIHPYGANPLAMLAHVRDARAALDRLGFGSVPLYITEFGWPTSPPGSLYYVPAARRVGYLTATMAALGHLDCGLAESLLYTWVTPQRDPHNREDWWGIEPPNGGASVDARAFTVGVARAQAPAPTVRLCGGA